MAKPLTGREAAFQALCRMAAGGYSNLTLDALLQQTPDGRERAFAAALFYGTLERRLTLDKALSRCLKKPPGKLDAEVLAALELAAYQLLYLPHIPERAAVGESVELVKHSRKKSAAGFVNGVLRSFLRGGKALPVPADPLAALELETSMPRWILALWAEQYGEETAAALAKSCLGRPPLQLRANTLKAAPEALAAELAAAGAAVERHPLLENCLTAAGLGAVGSLPAYLEGRCYVQDAASQLCAAAVAPEPGETVFDLCAAPGSKSFTMAQLMQDKGLIRAFDLHPQRVGLIREGAGRLGISIIQAETGDASVFRESLGRADRVLCDVPCSGLGVIRRKPEIRQKPPGQIGRLPALQLAILSNGADYVKPGGVLVYSTCALNRAENDEVAAAFLAKRPDFAPDPLPGCFGGLGEGHTATLMPHRGGYDGFFIARFRRIG